MTVYFTVYCQYNHLLSSMLSIVNMPLYCHCFLSVKLFSNNITVHYKCDILQSVRQSTLKVFYDCDCLLPVWLLTVSVIICSQYVYQTSVWLSTYSSVCLYTVIWLFSIGVIVNCWNSHWLEIYILLTGWHSLITITFTASFSLLFVRLSEFLPFDTVNYLTLW